VRGEEAGCIEDAAKFVERLAVENRAVVVVRGINEEAKRRMEKDVNSKLRHRIH
jgi:hypothetical protein